MYYNDESCIKNDELCINNDECCIKNDELCIKTDEFVLKMMKCAFEEPCPVLGAFVFINDDF